MPRIRSIKPEFWDDQKMARITRDARLVYIAIWGQADDYGVSRASLTYLKNKIFPHEEIPIKQFSGWIKELKDLKRLKPFSFNGENYFYLPYFKFHQVISHPSKMRYPSPTPYLIKDNNLTNISGNAPEGSGNTPEGSGGNPEGSGGNPVGGEVEGRWKGGGGEHSGAEPKKNSPPSLPQIPKGLDFKIQDDLKSRLAEIRQLKRKLADKDFPKKYPSSYKDFLCQLEKKEKKYRELIEDYS